MDKIICEVCGTTYPESSGQCPICGYVNPAKSSEETAYVPVKGGRFSSANVKRRAPEKPVDDEFDHAPASFKANKSFALGITVIVLLLILIMVLSFFIIKVLSSRGQQDVQPSLQTQAVSDDQGTTDDALQLHTDSALVSFEEAGQKHIIHVYTVPESTEPICFVSMNESVATVDASGTVTAVAAGETSVIARCGEANLVVTVRCDFADEDGKWSLNRKDITLKVGETWDLYSEDSTVAKNKISWSTEDEAVAKIADGIVEAVGSGITTVRGTYGGKEYTCTIRCKQAEESEESTTETKPDEQPNKVDPSKLKLWPRDDVTISVREAFTLQLRDQSGKPVDVQWTVSRDGYVSIEGSVITGLKSTANDFVTVSTTYGGQTFNCIIRVR